MKLLKNTEDNNVYLTKSQWRKVFLAVSIMTIVLYIVAMVFSLLGSKEFILNYQNDQLDKIEKFFKERNIISLISIAFSTLEFSIVLSYILKRITPVYYPLIYYVAAVLIAILLPKYSAMISYFFPFIFYASIPAIEQIIKNRKTIDNPKFNWKQYGMCCIRILIASVITFILQFIIYTIKAGDFTFHNQIMNLSSHFIYAIEYDIALSVLLYTATLYSYREKGDNSIWVTGHTLGGSSQTSTTQSQKSYMKNLTKLQKSRLKILFIRFFFTQILGFLIVMTLPFIVGKVFEFLVMYLSFAIVRYLLGFKYSLHYKKETVCITVGAVVFGILSLVVPFFYVVLISAIALGTTLAVLLHLSYKYKGMVLFNKVAKPDKFALLYVFFDA